jgi:hypothetical protein
MISKQSMIISGASMMVAMAGFIGAGVAFADTQPAPPISKMAQALANKFHISGTDVQSTMNQEQTAMHVDRQAKQKAKLDMAVKDGKLTQAQEDGMLQKMNTQQLDRQKTYQRRQQLKQDRQGLRQWLKDQNIDLKSILGKHNGTTAVNSTT